MPKNNFRCGFVTLAGRTNIGKSTLLNQIMQTEIAIATHKPQTTRHLIKGIYQDEQSQIIFIDSPGMHKVTDQLGRIMRKAASIAIQETDVVVLLIDARSELKIGEIEKQIIDLAISSKIDLILAINKIDLVAKTRILPLIQEYINYANFKAVVPISAKNNDGIDLLLTEIKKILPLNSPLIIDGSYTDQTERILAAEYIRAEIIEQISEEIPYSVAIKIEEFKELFDINNQRSGVQIHATIFVDRENHKMILLGKKGRQIAALGKASRERISEMLDCPCDLMLFVKVRTDWRNKFSQLKELGYSSQDLSL
ncbi:MAG TPA: GTPase Era [Clostridiaceae bacterium]|nr:GTPase Era [Clostridiaceae bacterium]